MTATATRTAQRQVIISADAHCGGDVLDYRKYLDTKLHDDFDAWAASYQDPWREHDDEHPMRFRSGLSSFASDLNWDSDKRRESNEAEGVVAEVLLPNTAPPFFPSNSITAPGPRTAEELALRWAGLQAHNRWLVDFCNDLPGRRAGFAQVFLDDLDAAIAEVRWAKEAGLRGVLLPSDHVSRTVNLYYPEFDRLWAVCEDLEMPVHRHGTQPTESVSEAGPASLWVGLYEGPFFWGRALGHLLCAGVFERFPKLKFVLVEFTGTQIPEILTRLDRMWEDSLGGNPSYPIQEAAAKLTRKPSEYFATNCYLGGPFSQRQCYDLGVPNLMFGTDLPHNEGTAPFTREALRRIFADVPAEDVTRMTSTTAADVYGFDLDQLQVVANDVGPTMEELTTPLPKDEWPNFPVDTRCSVWVENDFH